MSGPIPPPPPPPPNGPFPPSPNEYPPAGQPWPQRQPTEPYGQWPPVPPHKPRNGWKWGLAAVAVVAVIGVSVAVTVWATGRKDAGDKPGDLPNHSSTFAGEIKSATDTGPVTVITEDPTCDPQRPILNMRAAQQENGWDKRDPSIPAEAWTSEMRAQYEAVGESMRVSADQLVPIAKMTPHRVMRELYEQLIAYSRAYADSIPNYTEEDDNLARAAIATASVIANICSAIEYGSAGARGPLVPPLSPPQDVAPVADPGNPERFLPAENQVCREWEDTWKQFHEESREWATTDPSLSASEWGPEQKAINDDVASIMMALADKLQEMGERSGNPVLRDFANLSAQYRRAYVQALPTYTPEDRFLATTSLRLGGIVSAACRAVAG